MFMLIVFLVAELGGFLLWIKLEKELVNNPNVKNMAYDAIRAFAAFSAVISALFILIWAISDQTPVLDSDLGSTALLFGVINLAVFFVPEKPLRAAIAQAVK